MGRDVRFLRQAALLLPSACLIDVLVFLLSHGRKGPGFGTYPFFQQWVGDAAAAAPEMRVLEQALVFFLPAYAVALLFILSVSLAERVLFGDRRRRRSSAYVRAFGSVLIDSTRVRDPASACAKMSTKPSPQEA